MLMNLRVAGSLGVGARSVGVEPLAAVFGSRPAR